MITEDQKTKYSAHVKSLETEARALIKELIRTKPTGKELFHQSEKLDSYGAIYFYKTDKDFGLDAEPVGMRIEQFLGTISLLNSNLLIGSPSWPIENYLTEQHSSRGRYSGDGSKYEQMQQALEARTMTQDNWKREFSAARAYHSRQSGQRKIDDASVGRWRQSPLYQGRDSIA